MLNMFSFVIYNIEIFQCLTLQFPQNGELVLRRLVIQFRRGFKRNDKSICLSTTRFIAHLVNQQVVSHDFRVVQFRPCCQV